jgi:hypothetical protein
MFTTNEAENGIQYNVKLDLSNYAKKEHKHNIIDINSLDQVLMNKTPVGHTHNIGAIDGLNDIIYNPADGIMAVLDNHYQAIQRIMTYLNMPA